MYVNYTEANRINYSDKDSDQEKSHEKKKCEKRKKENAQSFVKNHKKKNLFISDFKQ